MSGGRTIVFATGNQGKARELRALLPGWEVLTLVERPVAMPEEVGESFEAIAVGKAEHACAVLGLPVLADDSGLEVDALGGAPGVRSARYVEGSDVDRYQKLLAALEGVTDRSARFVCALALAVPGEPSLVVRGTCEGSIATAPRGEGGFGYDPVFLVDAERTMAMLSEGEKNARSHRGAALALMAPHLARRLGGP